MKEITTIAKQLTNPRVVMEQVHEILKEVDPGFREIQRTYRENVAQLQEESTDREAEQIMTYLDARERAFSQEVLYIACQGLFLNMEIFRNPVSGLLLQEGYETLNREYLLESLPGVQLARGQAKAARPKPWSLKVQRLLEGIGEYYAYLETVGYKVAHYIGFRLADELLYYILPGYASNQANTIAYGAALEKYLQIHLDTLG